MAPLCATQLMNSDFDADPDPDLGDECNADPTFHSDADPYPASQNDADLFGSCSYLDPQHLVLISVADS
jgi:hypothetical protein